MSIVRCRFAPSPTGLMHIGNLRTALFSWLFARKNNGMFILRIEDTDTERSNENAVQVILDGLSWLGIDYNEGPFFQSQRMDIYKSIANKLLNEGKAYKCYCSKERLELLREKQTSNKEKPKYDGYCLDRNHEEAIKDAAYVIRFKMPKDGQTSFHDEVLGKDIIFENTELDDFVIIRQDGAPTYNFCVVVDDWLMKITHVIRGQDHINNTPKQIRMFEALNADIPVFAHVPSILGQDGKLLSKRHGAASVLQYREDGFLPEALLNYLVRLGWSHGDQEIFSVDEMISLFDMKNISKSPATINPNKLVWLNKHYLKTLPIDSIISRFQHHLSNFVQKKLHEHEEALDNDPKLLKLPNEKLNSLIGTQRERCDTLQDIFEKSRFLFCRIIKYSDEAISIFKNDSALDYLRAVINLLEKLKSNSPESTSANIWNKQEIHKILENLSLELGVKLGKIAQPIRAAITGGIVSPPIDVTLEILGKEETVNRLKKALDFFQNKKQYD